MTGALIVLLAKEIMERPDAHCSSIELLRAERDGIDATRIELVDAPLVTRGPNVGRPNWRRGSNREQRIILQADLEAAAQSWSKRTGSCIECTGTGREFVRWHHIEGTTWKDCKSCAGTGRSPSEAARSDEPQVGGA